MFMNLFFQEAKENNVRKTYYDFTEHEREQTSYLDNCKTYVYLSCKFNGLESLLHTSLCVLNDH